MTSRTILCIELCCVLAGGIFLTGCKAPEVSGKPEFKTDPTQAGRVAARLWLTGKPFVPEQYKQIAEVVHGTAGRILHEPSDISDSQIAKIVQEFVGDEQDSQTLEASVSFLALLRESLLLHIPSDFSEQKFIKYAKMFHRGVEEVLQEIENTN